MSEKKAKEPKDAKKEEKAGEVKQFVPESKKKSESRWNQGTCMRFAKRFDSMEAWSAGHPSSFKAAVAKGWDKHCSAHMHNVTSIKKAMKKPAARVEKPKTTKKSA